MFVTIHVLAGAGWTGVAWAWPGQAAWATYLRAGPGPEYAVIDEVGNHGEVDVLACEGGWCRVVYGAATGFVEADLVVARAVPGPIKPDAQRSTSCFVARQAGYPQGGDVRFCPRN